jgi:hypothetical protein
MWPRAGVRFRYRRGHVRDWQPGKVSIVHAGKTLTAEYSLYRGLIFVDSPDFGISASRLVRHKPLDLAKSILEYMADRAERSDFA